MIAGKQDSVIDIQFNLTAYPHSTVEIDFYLLLLNIWRKESLVNSFDKHLILEQSFESNDYPRTNICGSETEYYDRVIRVSQRIESVEKVSKLIFTDIPAYNEEFSSSRGWAVYGLNLRIGLECQQNAKKKIGDKGCECLPGFFEKQVKDCPKKGFNDNFCMECIACPLFCKTCSNELNCTECQSKLTLVQEGGKLVCDAPEGFSIIKYSF